MTENDRALSSRYGLAIRLGVGAAAVLALLAYSAARKRTYAR